MTHRGHGEGSIYRRQDGRWAAAITLPNGRRQAFYGRSRAEVAAKLSSAMEARDAGRSLPSGRETVANFLARWLEIVKPQLRERTWRRYEQLVRNQVVDELGGRRLSSLQAPDLQALYSHLLGGGLSPTTVHHVHMLLHRALGQAVRWGLLSRNVADLTDPPRMAVHEMQTLGPEEVRKFLAVATEDRLAALWLLAITTGMRQGELLGLRWTDLDLDHGALQVTGTLQRIPHQGMVRTETKTLRSRRRVLLGESAIAALRQRKADQAKDRLRASTDWQNTDLVFTNAVGKPQDPSELLRLFKTLLAAAGLPRVRFHDLRHTAATLMLRHGVHPKVAADMLGHSTVAITLDLYSHSTEPMHREAADILEGVVRGA